MSEERLVRLEMTLAETEAALHDLSDVVNKQWAEIELLQSKLKLAHSRIVSLEENAPTDTHIEKPPHY